MLKSIVTVPQARVHGNRTAMAVSSSVKVLEVESDKQSLSHISSLLSEDGCGQCGVAHPRPQALAENFSLEVRGKSCSAQECENNWTGTSK